MAATGGGGVLVFGCPWSGEDERISCCAPTSSDSTKRGPTRPREVVMFGGEAEQGTTAWRRNTGTRTATKQPLFHSPATANAARGKPDTEGKARTEPVAPEAVGRRLEAAAVAVEAVAGAAEVGEAAAAARRSGIVRQIRGKTL